MRSRWFALALLPVIWLPCIALTLALSPRLPAWAFVVAALVWVMLWRRRRASAFTESPVADDAPHFSPVRGGGY